MINQLDGLNMRGSIPSVFDDTTLSVWEMLNKILNKLTETIAGYNEFETNTNKAITDFETAINTSIEAFKNTTNTTIQDYILAYNTLKSYVDNYFINLNVQNEINTKINSLVSDGTFDTIINTTLFNKINSKINDLSFSISDYTELVLNSDYTNAINTAINTISELGGGTLLLPVGTFNIASIVPKNNVRLKGQGKGRTILKLKDNSNTFAIVSINSVHNFSIESLTINGNKVNNLTQPQLVEFRDSYNLYFNDVEFCSCNEYFLVHLDGCYPSDNSIQYNNVFENCYFDDFKIAGIRVDRLNATNTVGGAITVLNCLFNHSNYTSGSAGIFVNDSTESIAIDNCKFANMSDSAIIITSGVNIHINNCYGTTDFAGIWLGGNALTNRLKNVVVSNNTIKSNGDVSIAVTFTDFFQLIGNTCSENGMDGIWIQCATNGTIDGNNINNNGKSANAGRQSGIRITDNGTSDTQCSFIHIGNNNICDTQTTKTQLYGINFSSYGNFITCNNNNIIGNGTSNIFIVDGRLLNCNFRNNSPILKQQSEAGTSHTIDWVQSKLYKLIIYDVGGNITFKNAQTGDELILIINSMGAGGSITSWSSNVRFPSGSQPNIAPATGKYDILKFIFDGTNYHMISITQNLTVA